MPKRRFFMQVPLHWRTACSPECGLPLNKLRGAEDAQITCQECCDRLVHWLSG